MGLLPPGIKRFCTEIFRKYLFDNPENLLPPRGEGPIEKKIYKQNMAGGGGLPAVDSSIPQATLHFPPRDDPLWAVGELWMALSAVDLSFRGEALGRILGCRCSRRGLSARIRVATPELVS